ncbi:unnamed protein product [Mytilus coruscus]|uniref:Uncharacterized protein n=1 Tax=Mytilus coruscus TaxID=42192 RepID=A0A6J8EBB4_MYTCO|nr:unnamed protein product [Mytilus coruscus]
MTTPMTKPDVDISNIDSISMMTQDNEIRIRHIKLIKLRQNIKIDKGSKKKKKEQLTRLQSVDQRRENSPSSTNMGGNTILSANKSLNSDKAQGDYFGVDPSVTKCDKDLSSRVLPEGIVANTVNWHCKGYNGVDGLFSCIYRNYHNEKGCMEIIKMMIHSNSHDCDDATCSHTHDENESTNGEENGGVIEKNSHDCDDATCSHTHDENESTNGEENGGVIEKNSTNSNDTTDINTDDENKGIKGNENGKGNEKNDDKDNSKKHIFKLGAILGISVGITGTIILFLIILVVIFVCRRRSKKKKRKQMTRLQSIDQRFEMAHLECSPSSTNKGGNTMLSTNESLNTHEAQGEYFVHDPSITKYDKDLSNRKLSEITRFSGAEGDENVYYEIDEDKIESSTSIEGVHQKEIEEVRDKGSHHSHQTKNLLGSKKNREQLTRLQSVDPRIEMANLESSQSSTNKEGHTIISATTDESQGEYFVLDPSVTKYDKDLSIRILPDVKRFSVAQGDEKVYNEIDEKKMNPQKM